MERQNRARSPKLTFQRELTDALKKRYDAQQSLQNENTSVSEDDYDEYDDDDFDDEDDPHSPVLKSSAQIKSSKKSKNDDWSLPSYLKDDDDSDLLGGGGSMYLKQKPKNTQNKPVFDPFGMSKKDSKFVKEDHISEESETSEYDPIMELLKSKPKPDKQPTPAKRRGSSKDQDSSFPTPLKSPTRTLSPRSQQKDQPDYNEKNKFDYQGERSKSPINRVMSPKGRKSPLRESQRSPTFGKPSPELKGIITTMKSDDSHNPFSRGEQVKVKKTKEEKKAESFVDFLLDPSQPKPAPRKRGSSQDSQSRDSVQSPISRSMSPTSKDRREKERMQDEAKKFEESRRQRTLSGELGRSKSPLPSSMSSRTEYEPKKLDETKRQRTLSGEFGRSKSPPSRSMSPRPETEAKKFDESRRQKTLSGEIGRSKSSLTRSMSPGPERQKLTSMPLPSLQPIGRPLSAQATDGPDAALNARMSQSSKLTKKTEKEKSQSDANDILAMFDQAVQNDPVNFQAKMEEQRTIKSPVTEVVEKTESQKVLELQKQRSSRQLLDNVIDNVAQHNDTSDMSSLSEKGETKVKSPRTKSGKKSYRTPPTNYQGLGSLTMLKELKKGDETSQKNANEDVSTEDIRKKVYLEWLAKREEEAKRKRKIEAEKKKEEKQKLKEEREEKEKENAIVRMKWEEVKKEQDNEKARARRKKEEKEERDKLEKEKQKLKSEKDAEKRRQQLLENAKIKHKAELRKKHEEERKINKEKRNQKKESKKAVDEWMEKRSEKWVEDRKREENEKKREEKKEREQKKRDAEEADEKYNTWREKKDNQVRATMRENKMKQRREKYFIESDEENQRPPWSPPNKVIPRRR